MKLKNALTLALLCAGLTNASAERVSKCFQDGPALAQLRSTVPPPTLAPQTVTEAAPRGKASQAGFIKGAVASSPADQIIQAAAASARLKDGEETAQLFDRLLKEGTIGEKNEFAYGSGTYKFPARFYPAFAAQSICEWITKTWCWLACTGTGVERQCNTECRDILVQSCHN